MFLRSSIVIPSLPIEQNRLPVGELPGIIYPIAIRFTVPDVSDVELTVLCIANNTIGLFQIADNF